MKIKIVQVGKNKEADFDNLMKELVKRISGFADIEVVTVSERRVSPTFSVGKVLEKEGEEILKAVEKERNMIILDEKGKEFSSKDFAGFMQKYEDNGEQLCFVIGGAFGLAEEVKKRANGSISMSKMTFTHQMVRIFLLEQIYRAFCIIRGKEYHHE